MITECTDHHQVCHAHNIILSSLIRLSLCLPYVQEQASTLAVATSADTAKTGLGHALRANIRWCQGNLLGAYEDLQIAQQAMQASESRYATNISEV